MPLNESSTCSAGEIFTLIYTKFIVTMITLIRTKATDSWNERRKKPFIQSRLECNRPYLLLTKACNLRVKEISHGGGLQI